MGRVETEERNKLKKKRKEEAQASLPSLPPSQGRTCPCRRNRDAAKLLTAAMIDLQLPLPPTSPCLSSKQPSPRRRNLPLSHFNLSPPCLAATCS
jgi:hypothetical protein